MERVLIVEDDFGLRDEITNLLKANGYETGVVDSFGDVRKITERILAFHADMVLMDINLPGADGGNILKEIRKESNVPVIMVTSRNTEMDEVLCMSFGADDFIAKPFNPSILLLHMEALFKRIRHADKRYTYDRLAVDAERGIMEVDGKVTELSRNETKILSYLIKNAGKIVSRDELMSYLWDMDEFIDDNTLTVNINRVRKKLEDAGLHDIIRTKRGQGYAIG